MKLICVTFDKINDVYWIEWRLFRFSMCGICGWITKKDGIDYDIFEKMNSLAAHRGPDDSGIWSNAKIAMGHRRLAVIDVTKAGHQPYENEALVLTYNGEIYNYLELREELERLGYRFSTHTDVEVLAVSYMQWGENCVSHFNGMWSFAVYDKAKDIVFCSRDRFGVKPLYYFTDESKFCFSSEIKQLLPAIGHKPKANKDALLQFIVKGNLDYSEATCFEDIIQVLPGTNVIYDIGTNTYQIYEYYNYKGKQIRESSLLESTKTFFEYFSKSVSLRLRSDVPIGFCLSGGLDSSAIASVANYVSSDNCVEWHTVSACYDDTIYDEREYIEEVNTHIGATSHKVFPSFEMLFEELDDIIWHMDEPFGSTSIFAQWNVFKCAQEAGLTVMLDGQGADEQLCGYTSLYVIRFSDLISHFKIMTFIKEWKAYKKLRASTEKYLSSSILFFNSLARSMLPERLYYFVKMKAFIRKNGGLFPKEVVANVLRNEPRPKGKGVKEFVDFAISTVLLPLFHYEDRNSMAFSIESRLPFMDYQLVEAVYQMPFDHKIKNGITKVVLRESLKGILPEKIRLRYSKLGFETPEDKWMSSQTNKWREELEKSLKTLNGIIDSRRILDWFCKNEGHFKRGDSTIWRIICAAHWIRVFNVDI